MCVQERLHEGEAGPGVFLFLYIQWPLKTLRGRSSGSETPPTFHPRPVVMVPHGGSDMYILVPLLAPRSGGFVDGTPNDLYTHPNPSAPLPRNGAQANGSRPPGPTNSLSLSLSCSWLSHGPGALPQVEGQDVP